MEQVLRTFCWLFILIHWLVQLRDDLVVGLGHVEKARDTSLGLCRDFAPSLGHSLVPLKASICEAPYPPIQSLVKSLDVWGE
jgi:hypothetical protein